MGVVNRLKGKFLLAFETFLFVSDQVLQVDGVSSLGGGLPPRQRTESSVATATKDSLHVIA
jgi:hypothetical protein